MMAKELKRAFSAGANTIMDDIDYEEGLRQYLDEVSA